MRVFITGIGGLLGTHLAARFISEGWQITALVRNQLSEENAKQNLSRFGALSEAQIANIAFVHGSLDQTWLYTSLLSEAGAIVHCAGMVSFHASDRQELYKNNVLGTASIVDAALEAGVPYFVHLSSVATLCSVRGNSDISEKPLDAPTGKKSVYATSKYLAEREVWRGIEEGLQAVILNPSVILGYHDWNKGSAAMFRTAANGLRFYTQGVTGFVLVDDVSEAIVKSIKKKITSERIIISAGNFSFREIFNEMAKGFGEKEPAIHAGPWMSKAYVLGSVIWGLLKGKKPLITAESARSAHAIRQFDNSKSLQLLDMRYGDIMRLMGGLCEKYKQKI
jgi:nucleoside-diphosphate-sugar epimerase